jgi:tetratricopeptide (TPR) repeat protein
MMKITKISTLVVDARMRNWVFVRVDTSEAGLYGWGEATLEWKTRGVVGAVDDLSELLIGQSYVSLERPHHRYSRSGLFVRLAHLLVGWLFVATLHVSSPFCAQAAPQSAVSLAQQISGSLAAGANQQASRIPDQLLTRPTLDPDLLLRTGMDFADHGMYPEASRAFARCAHDRPQDFEAHYNLALADLAQAELPEALSTIEQAPHRSPTEDAARLYLRGKVEAALAQNDSAERDLSAAFAKRPGEENYALDLGVLYLRGGSYARAEAVFARGVRRHATSAYLLLGQVLAQFLRGRTTDSLATCRLLLNLQPDFSSAQLLLSFSLYLDGKLDEAQKLAAAGLGRPHQDPFLYYLDAAILMKRGIRRTTRASSGNSTPPRRRFRPAACVTLPRARRMSSRDRCPKRRWTSKRPSALHHGFPRRGTTSPPRTTAPGGRPTRRRRAGSSSK